MASTSAGASRSAHFLPQRPERVRTRRRSTAASTSFSRAGVPRPGMAGDRTSFMSTDSGYFESEDYWDEEEETVPSAHQQDRPKEEPMSPVAVVLYVVFFYVVWQILTRSDDGEILEHLPSGSPLFSASSHQPSYERNAPTPQYQLPYALQQIPSPMPSINADSLSTWRWVLGMLVYPIYVGVTLIAIPLPFLMNALNLIVNIVTTILYPITSTCRLLARTFLLAPLNVLMGFLHALYPVYVFVGGVVGAGAFIGVAFGWVGRMVLSIVLKPRSTQRRRKSTRTRTKRTSSSARSPAQEAAPPSPEPVYTHTSHPKRHSMPPVSPAYSPVHTTPARPRPTSGSFEPRSRPTSGQYERRFVPIVDVIEIDEGGYLPFEQSHSTARPGVVLGVRRRGARI